MYFRLPYYRYIWTKLENHQNHFVVLSETSSTLLFIQGFPKMKNNDICCILLLFSEPLTIRAEHLPNSCGSSSHNTARETLIPRRVFSVKAAPMDKPSTKL